MAVDRRCRRDAIAAVFPGITPGMAAAVFKLYRNRDRIAIAAGIRVMTRFRNAMGLPGTLAIQSQPNHPTDDPAGIAASTLDGLLMGEAHDAARWLKHRLFSGRGLLVDANDGAVDHQILVVAVRRQCLEYRSQTPAWHQRLNRRCTALHLP